MRSFAFDRLVASVAVLDRSGQIVDTNVAWRLFAQLNDGSLWTTGIGANYLDVCDRSSAEDATAALVGRRLREILAGDRVHFDLEYWCASPTEDRWFHLRASAAPVDGGAGAIVAHEDITARKRSEQRLSSSSEHDPSTGLAWWRPEPAQSGRPGRRGAVLVVDVGDLGEATGRLGSYVEDELLVKAASRIGRAADGGVISRMADGSFVIEGGGWGSAQADRVSAALRDVLALPFQVGADVVSINAAVGAATGTDGAGADSLIARAAASLAADRRRTAERADCCSVLASRLPWPALTPVEAAEGGRSDSLIDQLRAAQAVTDAVLAHSQDVVMMFDAEGTITWVSPSSLAVLGIAPSSLVGRNGFEIIHPDDQGRALADFLTIPGLGDHVCTEFRTTVGGQTRWVEEIATNLLDEPAVGSIVGNLRDITDRKAGEAAVQLQASLLAAAGQAIVARNNEGEIIYWNDAAEKLFGWTSDEVAGRRARDLLRPVDPDDARMVAAAADVDAGRPWEGEWKALTKSGKVVTVLSTASPALDSHGTVIGMTVVSMDITEEVARRRAAEEARRRLSEAQASANLGSFEIDVTTGNVTRSEELCRILGVEPGAPAWLSGDAVHPEDRDRVEAAQAAALAGQPDISCTHRIVRPDGTVRWVVSSATQTRGPGGLALAGTMLDVTERYEAELALTHQATHDALTGLPNRRLLVTELETSLDRSSTSGRVTGVVFIDLDDFKAVNDRFGHTEGDEVLRSIGERLQGAADAGDTVARIGGDEYVVCCDDLAGEEELLERAARLEACLRTPFRVRNLSHTLSASLGLALSSPGTPAESLLRNADSAMYAAKQGGGARAELFDDALYADLRRRQELAAEIAVALESGQFQTYFQPEVALRTGSLIGFEALVRWHHPERGIIAPSEFIDIAEQSGTIGQLGRRVLADGCRALASWIDTAPEQRLTIAINVSPLQLADPAFPADVQAAIEAADVPAGRVCLEVTESSLMDPDVAAEALRNLKTVGVNIAIDDFGTGYSSLSRLKRFPVDLLKIDRSFVDGLGSDPEAEVIVATVINLARSLGIEVIAEGVETQEQLDVLAGYGCELGQGYVWSAAMPLADASAYIATKGPRRHASMDPAPLAPLDQPHADAASTVAFLVHELAGPLTLIMGYAGLARELSGPDDLDMLDVALGAVERASADMAGIVANMADTRALDEGTLRLDRQPHDISRLVSELVAERALSGSSTPISLGSSEPLFVRIDAACTRQILTNLLNNAETWSPEDTSVELTVEAAGSTVLVSIIDRGPGVANDRIGDLFRKFSRPDRRNPGTGLGLYIARQLARIQGGDLRYRRAEGGGSQFILDLPRA